MTKMKLVTASWCGPCSELKAWMRDHGIDDVAILDIHNDYVEIGKLQEEAMDLVRVLPTLFFDGTAYHGREEIKPVLSYVYGIEE